MSTREKLIKILREIDPDIDYDKETALIDDGLFDSLEILSIIAEVERVFNKEVDPDDVVSENFNSVDALLKIVEK